MYQGGQPRRGTVRRFLCAAVLAFVGVLLAAGPAQAHATLISTDPVEGSVLDAAPEQVTFTFDEPVRTSAGSVKFFDATGTELAAEGRTQDTRLLVDLPGSLADGTYIVAWRAISTDGHPIGGALTFSIGAPSERVVLDVAQTASSPPSVRVAQGVAQAALYLGVFGATGLAVFALLLLPREGGTDRLRVRLEDLMKVFAWTAVVAGALTLLLNTMYQRGQDFSALFADEPFVVPTGAALASYALAALGLAATVFGTRRATLRPQFTALALGGAAAALGSLALVGHTRAFAPLWLIVAADLAHVAAGAVWFGGLIGLVISLSWLGVRPRLAAQVLSRFSGLAAWLLLAVAITGTVLGWRILGSASALIETDFGRILLIKVGLVGLVAAVAGWNRYRLLPAVLADGGFAERGAATGRLRRSVRVEAVLLVAVLGFTGFLVDRSPVPDQSAITLPGGFDATTFTGQFGGVRVVAVVEPAGVGKNEVLIQLQDNAGDPLEPALPPGLSASQDDLALGDQPVRNVDSGTYRATVLLPRPGTWTFSVSVPLSEFDSPVISIKVPVGQTP